MYNDFNSAQLTKSWARAICEVKSRPQFVNERLFHWQKAFANLPYGHTTIDNLEDIACILRSISHYRLGISHMFFPEGGGLDLIEVNLASEHDCITLNSRKIIKPKCLHIFKPENTHHEWWHMRLETSELQPHSTDPEDVNSYGIERCLEFEPGQYTDPYYYDLGYLGHDEYGEEIELPSDAKLVSRRLKSGEFITFFCKCSLYNLCNDTYHSKYSSLTLERFEAFVVHWEREICDLMDYPQRYWGEVRQLCQNLNDAQCCKQLVELLCQSLVSYPQLTQDELIPYAWSHVQRALMEGLDSISTLAFYCEREDIESVFALFFKDFKYVEPPFSCNRLHNDLIDTFSFTILGLERMLEQSRQSWQLISNNHILGSDIVTVRYNFDDEWQVFFGRGNYQQLDQFFEQTITIEQMTGFSEQTTAQLLAEDRIGQNLGIV